MPYVVIARVLTQPWHLRVSVFSDHLCASPLFRREGDLQISKILKDCWMKATLEHNTGPVSPDCMGGGISVKSMSLINPRPAVLWKVLDVAIEVPCTHGYPGD